MWDYIKKNNKPVVLYGTGNAADKVLDECQKRNIKVSAVFASDGFVRDRMFRGFHVISYSEAKRIYRDMLVLLCFGTHLSEVIDNICNINSEQELLCPDFPVAGGGLFSSDYCLLNNIQIAKARNTLYDSQSRFVFDNVIEYKKSGKLSYLFDCESPEKENMRILNLGYSEEYLDLGAYNGDTLVRFLNLTAGKYKQIIAVEPDRRNFRKLKEGAGELENVHLLNQAVSDKKEDVCFSRNLGRGGAVQTSGSTIKADSVDNILSGSSVSYIKMDLEGYEHQAIIGAEKTIRTYKPKMLISAYHRLDDLWKIPELVLNFNPDYKVYLRKNPCIPAWEINYYFI